MRWTAAALPASLLLLLSLACASEPQDGRATLEVFAAASLSDAFREIAQISEAEAPGLVVRCNLAGSHQLALQIEQGAPAAVYASADARWMDYLRERGLLAGEPAPFAGNRLVVIVPARGSAVSELRDLARPGARVVLANEAAPAGRYAREAIRRLSRSGFGPDFARRVLENVVSEEDNVRAVLMRVQLGEADAGFVYRSDLRGNARGRLRAVELPDSSAPPAIYRIAVVRGARDSRSARAFVDRVLSPAGQAVLAGHGLLPLAALGADFRDAQDFTGRER